MPFSTVNASADITTFQQASALYARASQAQRNANAVKVCNNTYLKQIHHMSTDDACPARFGWVSYALVFHGSVIVQYGENGSIEMDAHGYRTATTKHRMNQFTPFAIYQQAGDWFVRLAGECNRAYPFKFRDGIRFVPADTVAGYMHMPHVG